MPAGPPMVAAVKVFPARSRRQPHGGPTPSGRYDCRRPEQTPFLKVVSESLEGWRDRAERPVPGHVADELRGYLECRLLCFGFARADCMTRRTGFVVAISCKGRGICPSCNGRHMAQTAAHLVDHVIPLVPVRQWVISVPKRLHGLLADQTRAGAMLTRIFLAEIGRILTAAGRQVTTKPPGRRTWRDSAPTPETHDLSGEGTRSANRHLELGRREHAAHEPVNTPVMVAEVPLAGLSVAGCEAEAWAPDSARFRADSMVARSAWLLVLNCRGIGP